MAHRFLRSLAPRAAPALSRAAPAPVRSFFSLGAAAPRKTLPALSAPHRPMSSQLTRASKVDEMLDGGNDKVEFMVTNGVAP